MRKPQDIDGELRALADKTRALQARKVTQLGQLVIACGADALTVEQLAGVLLAAVESGAEGKEGAHARGASFFLRTTRRAAKRADRNMRSTAPGDGGAASA